MKTIQGYTLKDYDKTEHYEDGILWDFITLASEYLADETTTEKELTLASEVYKDAYSKTKKYKQWSKKRRKTERILRDYLEANPEAKNLEGRELAKAAQTGWALTKDVLESWSKGESFLD